MLPLLSAEQRAIAEFLDRETGRVDRLVAKKRELIERLKEKRTALISRTVTRGLPPAAARAAGLPDNPPLKPSGLDWLGDIPKHWEVDATSTSLSHLDYGPFEPDHYPGKVRPFVLRECGNINGEVDARQRISVRTEMPSAFLRSKTEICVRSIETLSHGDVAQWSGYVGGRSKSSFCRTACCARRSTTRSIRRFHRISAMRSSSALEHVARGSSARCINMSNRHLTGVCQFARPPLPEQAAIAAYLDEETAKLDALVGKVEEAVERLQEYRTALITAAVTGKIDVRKVTA